MKETGSKDDQNDKITSEFTKLAELYHNRHGWMQAPKQLMQLQLRAMHAWCSYQAAHDFIMTLNQCLCSYNGWKIRAVGAGLAGPAAAGPIFDQLTCAKMPYELWWIVQLLL